VKSPALMPFQLIVCWLHHGFCSIRCAGGQNSMFGREKTIFVASRFLLVGSNLFFLAN